MNELVAKYFAEMENEGCSGGHASSSVKDAVNDFAAWLAAAQQSFAPDSLKAHVACPQCAWLIE